MDRRTGLALLVGLGAGTLLLRRWQLRFGTPAEFVDAPLAGDGIVADADVVATRSVHIKAPAAQVWPWVVQLGQGRGGFYSYDALENLLGCDIHSATQIVADWQHLEVGDEVRLHPEAALAVAHVEVGRALVLEGSVSATGASSVSAAGAEAATPEEGLPSPASADVPAPPYDFTWAFVLRDADDEGCWLVVRERYGYRRRWAPLLIEPVAAVSFVMTHRMLRGIRLRAEAHA